MKNLYEIYESILDDEDEIINNVSSILHFDQFVEWATNCSGVTYNPAFRKHCIPAKDRMDVRMMIYLNIDKDTPLPPVKLGIVECIDIHGDNAIWNHPEYLPTETVNLDLVNGSIKDQKLNVMYLTIRKCGINNCEFVFPASIPGLRKNVSVINWEDSNVKTWDDIKTCKFTSEGCILGLNICRTGLADAVVRKMRKDWEAYKKTHPYVTNKEPISRNREINECFVKSINDLIPLDEFHKQNPKVQAIYFKMKNSEDITPYTYNLKLGDVMISWDRIENGVPQWKVAQRAIKV